MARRYTFKDRKTKRTIYDKVHPNYMSLDDVCKLVQQKTGRNPCLERGSIDTVVKVEN